MGKETQETLLRQSIRGIKTQFEDVDIETINDINNVREFLADIDGVHIEVTQYKTRFGDNAWRPWGVKIWGDVEKIEASLRKTLARLEREELQTEKIEEREHEIKLINRQIDRDSKVRIQGIFIGGGLTLLIGLILIAVKDYFFSST